VVEVVRYDGSRGPHALLVREKRTTEEPLQRRVRWNPWLACWAACLGRSMGKRRGREEAGQEKRESREARNMIRLGFCQTNR
jgi:hypothetical protein